jgi:hypothetical protein
MTVEWQLERRPATRSDRATTVSRLMLVMPAIHP